MNALDEEKRTLQQRIENLIRKHEEDEAELAAMHETIRKNRASSSMHIGPANDLLRFLYILDQQYLNDNAAERLQARQNVLDYLAQFQPKDVSSDEEEEEETESEPVKQPVDVSVPTTTLSHPPPTPAIVTQQVPQITTTPQAQAPIATAPPVPSSSINGWAHITEYTLKRYEPIVSEAKEYHNRFQGMDEKRALQLGGPIKSILNKLLPDTLNSLERDLFDYLNGRVQKLGAVTFQVSTHGERLFCLFKLADSILRQLLGGDLNDLKTKTLLPLIGHIVSNPQCQEFRTIFLDCLHKKCPYTVPLFPKRLPTMSDIDYLKAMGYIEKQDGGQMRLETEDEFLTRMVGFVRLFWRLAANHVPPFDKDLFFGWEWCANVLNLPVQPNLTVLLIRVFLEEAGEMMYKAYPTDFPKLVRTIKKDRAKFYANTSPSERAHLDSRLAAFP